MPVKHLNSDAQFLACLDDCTGLLVVDFFATWCGPCQQIAPFVEQLSQKHPQVTFAKIDTDVCQSTAASQGVSAMPTFIFYIKKVKVDSVRGANSAELEAKLSKWAQSLNVNETADVPGQTDLSCFISKKECECLNEKDSHTFKSMLESTTDNLYLESDCDEQLIINVPFSQPVKLHSIRIKGPAKYGPKSAKIFINSPVTLDFDKANRAVSLQTLNITEEQCVNGEIISLVYVKFQNVRSVTIFIDKNQGDMDTTKVSRLQFYGSPLNSTNMQDFKRVAGKPGEGHH